ncbi:archaeosortase A [Natrinema sp. SYSU A 869]|uniref:archaeosortase A n=1 Tax=Natrinema sp. SYSU A 869 TaxID=2871694 RepID=UPI001CA4490E|nr:archaeosortase A [Natrinema sp. SYSU A 869]
MSALPVTTAAAATDVDLAATGTMSTASAVLGSLGLSDWFAWIAISTFVVAMALQWSGATDRARYVAAAAWAVFGVYWIMLVPYYYGELQSPLETLLALAALPLCLYTSFLLVKGRESLLLLSKAVAFMGLIYLPAETIPIVRTWLIETTAAQTHFGMELLGHSPGLTEGSEGYLSKFDFDSEKTVTGRTTYIIMACTGIGSMAIFGGLIAAVNAPLKRKAIAFASAIGIIWFLNLSRNVFIGIASPWGWFQQDVFVYIASDLMGAPASRTSYIVAHNFIAQTLSIVALLGITYLVVRVLPEVLEPLEDVLYILTGSEYDLKAALGEGMRADGGTDASQSDSTQSPDSGATAGPDAASDPEIDDD